MHVNADTPRYSLPIDDSDYEDARREAAEARRRQRHRYDPLCGCPSCEPDEHEEPNDETEEEES